MLSAVKLHAASVLPAMIVSIVPTAVCVFHVLVYISSSTYHMGCISQNQTR